MPVTYVYTVENEKGEEVFVEAASEQDAIAKVAAGGGIRRSDACTESHCFEPADGDDGLCQDCREDVICRADDCDERSDGGDGWDGYCGNCADKRFGDDDDED